MEQKKYAIEKRTFSIVGLVAGLITGIIAGALLGVALAIFSEINPFIYISVLGTIIAAGALWYIVDSVGERFGSTDLFSAVIVSIVAVFTMTYIYYSMWLKFEGVGPWANTPITQWYEFGIFYPFTVTWQEIAPYFSYSVSRRSSSGADVGNTMTYVAWGIELIILVALPVLLAFGRKPSVVNPNTGGRMAEISSSYLPFPDDENEMVKLIEARDFSKLKAYNVQQLNELYEASEHGAVVPMSQVIVYKDRKDENVYSLRYALGNGVVDDDNWDYKFHDDALVKYMLITSENYKALQAQLLK